MLNHPTCHLRHLALILLLVFSLNASFAQSFAALTIIPSGRQSFDITTGVTTLADGGEIIDKTEKLSLVAANIELNEAEFISATTANVDGEFGSFSTESLYIDVLNQRLETSAVELSYKNLVITADSLILFLDTDIAKLSGNVTSSSPEFSASAIFINLETGFALLGSPFVFQNGPLVLRQENAGKQLQLSPRELEDGNLNYQASSQVEESVLANFSPYMTP